MVTHFTYTGQGDLASVTDARTNTSTYSNYHRGIAQLEEHPEAVTLSRVIKDTGTLASQTNGRGYTRTFTYDDMNRLTGITYPLNAPVSIAWDAQGKTLSRGSYRERIDLDDFGRPVSTTRSDTALGINVTQDLRYDVHGNKVFESYPNSESGVRYAYDVLHRLTALQHPDGANRSVEYLPSGKKETDERGNVTSSFYERFGAPDNASVLAFLGAPENVATFFSYDQLLNLTQVLQGTGGVRDDGSYYVEQAYARSLGYDQRFYLTSVDDPETGLTQYGRDELGNLTSRQVGTSGITTYTYDQLNRQTFTDYPGTTPDVSTRYDADGHVTQITNGDSVIDYLYDENDNLRSQTLSIGAVLYPLAFTYDPHDFLSTMRYPSGRVVDYLPDALGRPTQVAPYVSAVSYHPGGQLAQLNHVNGQVTDIALNERQWVGGIHHQGPGGATELNYGYDPLGNVRSITDVINPTEDRNLGYDGLNRLTSAQGRWGTGSFSYDTYGNLTSMALGADSHQFSYSGLKLQSVIHNDATRSWYAHDVYGNVRADTELVGLDTVGQLVKRQEYLYNDVGRLRQATEQTRDGSGDHFRHHDFDYDAAGNRMRRTDPQGQVTDFVYGRTGQLLGEYTGTRQFGKEYIYLGAQQVASAQTNRPPVADAGTDQSAGDGTTVTLDGSASRDPDGAIASYAWRQTQGTAVTLTGASGATPSFTAPAVAGVLGFELTVTDAQGEQDSAAVTVSVYLNQPPISDAGPNQSALGASVVILDGSVSSDPEGAALGYRWRQLSGGTVTLSNASGAQAQFKARNVAETLRFELTVTDPLGRDSIDTVDVSVAYNQPPYVTIGYNQINATRQRSVTLNGGDSYDPEGTALRYKWTQINIFGEPTVVLTGATTATLSFAVPIVTEETTLVFKLVVHDAQDLYATVTAWVTIGPNHPPVADAGNDLGHNGLTRVELWGRGSDRDWDSVLRFDWRQTGASSVTLMSYPGAECCRWFTAPLSVTDETLSFELTVTDPDGAVATDTMSVTVRANTPPVVDVGTDRSVLTGAPATLDGTVISYEPEALRYAWQQRSGTPVTLTAADTPQPSFTAPATAETLVFELTVTDTLGLTGSDTVNVVVHAPPVAAAGADRSVNGGVLVTLDGTASRDPEGGVLSYAWRQVTGVTVTLSNPATATASFTAPYVNSATDLEFELEVTDPQGARSTDGVRITILRNSVAGDTRAPRSTLTRLSNGTRRITVNEVASSYAQILNARPWWIYNAPFPARKGEIVEYYAVDRAGNREPLRRYVTP